MESTLTWLDLTSSDRDKMRRVLDLFSEQGTVDEMGLGSLRDGLSDALFPGTSTFQTRLRYMLFIPWIYQRLEKHRLRGDEVAQRARGAEIALIEPLLENEDQEGVIGRRARGSLRHLPSSGYWSGLVRWGIFAPQQSQSWYHTTFKALTYGYEGERTDDPGVVWSRETTWHPRLPEPPESFSRTVSFALTREEAEFLQGRIFERCAGSLLAWLAQFGSTILPEQFWDTPNRDVSDELHATVELTRRFSLHVEGMPLLYNLLLAERIHEQHGEEKDLVDSYRAELTEWAGREDEESTYDSRALWEFMDCRGVPIHSAQRRFVESWSQTVTAAGATATADNAVLRQLVEQRERQLKGPRARLGNLGRLLAWSGRAGVGRMDFRWFRVRQLLVDLHQGLGS